MTETAIRPVAYASRAHERALLAPVQRDRSLDEGGLWQRCQFTTPATTAHDRVEFYFDAYRLKFGKSLEQGGWEVVYMGQPFIPDDYPVPTEPDRRMYNILAWVKRRPKEVTFWVPDSAVTKVLGAVPGLKLED